MHPRGTYIFNETGKSIFFQTLSGSCLKTMTQLHKACERGDLEEVTSLLSNNDCDINMQDSCGETALHIACQVDHINIVRVLIGRQECDLNIQDRYGNTALHITSMSNHHYIVEVLIADQRCKLNIQNRDGATPLLLACYIKSLNIIRLLLGKKSSILNKKGETTEEIPLNEDGDCLLHIACQWGDADIVQYLISDQRCNPTIANASKYTPLHIASKHGHLGVIKVLVCRKECNINIPDDRGNTPLHTACKHGHHSTVEFLVADQRCQLNTKNSEMNTPLHVACHAKSLKIIRLLLKRKCTTNTPNKKGETAEEIPLNEDGDCLLHIACQWGDVDIVQYLISDQRCNPNIANSALNTPLHTAVKHKQSDVIAELLSYGKCIPHLQNRENDTPLHIAGQNETIVQLLSCGKCNLNVNNKQGDTPLHIAVRENKKFAFSRLLARKECDPNAQNKEGDTPLHIAVRENKKFAFSRLLARKECDPNAQNKEGDTPLHIAVRENKKFAFSRLLARKECDPNAQNKEGDTPLHIAVTNNQTAAISKLLAHKQCDPTAQNNEGDTPLHIACLSKFSEVIRLLMEKRYSTNVRNNKGEIAQQIPFNEDGDCLLHLACQWGDVGIIRNLITNQRCDPNVGNSFGNTPLHVAVKYEQIEAIVQLLSYKQCNPDGYNREGDTPLHIAVRENKTAALSQLLMHRQCDSNVPNKEGDTPLHIAVRNKAASLSQLLAHEQCDPNVPNKEGDTPLHIAVRNKAASLSLLAHEQCDPNVPNKEGDTPLHIAVRENNTIALSQLLAHEQCDPNVPNKEGDTPLHIAVKHQQNQAITQLLSYRKCNPNICNREGDTPLHIAVRNKAASLSQLLAHEQCDPNVPNKEGDTPLHIACNNKFSNAIKLLLELGRCSTNIPNKKGVTAQQIPLDEDGDCLLHFVCQGGDVCIIKYLITDQRCNPNIRNSCMNTPLHIAVKYYQTGEIIVQLLSCEECNPNVCNREGDTPLHTAVKENKTAALSQLLMHRQCDSNVPNKEGDTPLHIACNNKFSNAIKLLLELGRCSTNIPNKKGVTAQQIPLNKNGDCLLHLACQWGDVCIIRYLITDQRCNPNIGNSSMNTPLHIAVREKKTTVLSELLDNKMCDPNIKNENADTPLHIAVTAGNALLCEFIMVNDRCDVNIFNKAHLTPLLSAFKHKKASVATALLQHRECDLTLCDSDGNTALHLACIGGETQSEMVKIAKQLLTTVDPSPVNSAGQTPIELTTNYQLIQAISQFSICKTKHSVQTYINIFIVGNPETGKSTLVEAIRYEANILWRIVPKFLRMVRNVPPHTAGIIPTTFRSKIFGNTVLYDLAGRTEYYTSHAAVIQTTVISTPPAFIIVVNMSESEEKISETLRYWCSFINNHAARASAPPQVILVGSHADKVEARGGSAQEMMSQVSALLKRLPASFYFAGQVALDCRDFASSELRLFCSLVNKSCCELRQTADVDLRCHVLYAFLLEKFPGKVACTVSDITTIIQESDALLPQNPDGLIPLISTLSDKGLLLLVADSVGNEDSWVILQKPALLGEINGTIFAPKYFSQHKNDLSTSTGVVPLLKLKREFPDYNPDMIAKFLTHLELCFKVDDHQTLDLLKDEIVHEENMPQNPSEDYYFFPALVSVENPLQVWEQDDVMISQCGWFYRCSRHDQFLTTQFLHVLILRLAFSFALQLHAGDLLEDSLALHRRCSVWKRGIGWLNRVPIEAVVEVGLLNQSVIVMMRCPKGEEAKCAQLRLEVIQKVLKAKDELCKAVIMSESFIHPTDIKYPFIDNTEDLKYYSLTEIAIATVKEADNVLDNRGRNPFPVKDLLLFNPKTTASRELLRELFSEKHSLDEQVRGQVLEKLLEGEAGLYKITKLN